MPVPVRNAPAAAEHDVLEPTRRWGSPQAGAPKQVAAASPAGGAEEEIELSVGQRRGSLNRRKWPKAYRPPSWTKWRRLQATSAGLPFNTGQLRQDCAEVFMRRCEIGRWLKFRKTRTIKPAVTTTGPGRGCGLAARHDRLPNQAVIDPLGATPTQALLPGNGPLCSSSALARHRLITTPELEPWT